MPASALLVTIALGERHSTRWHRYCKPGWERYARRHGFDVICLDEPLDISERARARSPSWQKCLVLGQPFAAAYERVVWIDADVVINPLAPSVVEGVPVGKVGAVDEFAAMPEADPRQLPRAPFDIWDFSGRAMTRNAPGPAYYAGWGLPDGFEQAVQAGVLVLSPAHHREVLEHVYATYEDLETGLFEMGPLSYELLKADRVHWIDDRFNVLWMHCRGRHFPFLVEDAEHERAAAAVAQGIDRVFFMHFAAADEAITLVDPDRPVRARRAAGRAAAAEPYRCRTPVVLLRCAGSPNAPHAMDLIREAGPPELVVVERSDQAPGLDGVFETFEEAIVLRDDCAAHPSFFRFCDELLERHRDDPQVLSISGNNFQFGHPAGDGSYYFSRYPHTWGWATWRRAWRTHDPAMAAWPKLRDAGWLEELLGDPHAVRYWNYLFEQAHRGLGSWDYAWTLTCWRTGGLTALPNVNLSSKLGSGPIHLRTRTGHRGAFEDMAVEEIAFPLRHPEAVGRDMEADAFSEDVLFSGHMRRMFERAREAALRARSGRGRSDWETVSPVGDDRRR